MQIIKTVFCFIFFTPLISIAQTDQKCLNHLGGAFSGVECYSGLSNDLATENEILIKKINKTIPRKNKNKALLKKYLKHQSEDKNYCTLIRDSYTGWSSEKPSTNPRYHDYDVVYYACVHEILTNQNKFLKEIIKNIAQ